MLVRPWLKDMDEIDRDCVYRYEYLLGRKLRDRAEYRKIDAQVDEMVLEFEDRKEFFAAYPKLVRYKKSIQEVADTLKKAGYKYEIQSDTALRVYFKDKTGEHTQISLCDDTRDGYYMISGKVQNLLEWVNV